MTIAKIQLKEAGKNRMQEKLGCTCTSTQRTNESSITKNLDSELLLFNLELGVTHTTLYNMYYNDFSKTYENASHGIYVDMFSSVNRTSAR